MDTIEPQTPAEPMADQPAQSEMVGPDTSVNKIKLEGYFNVQSPSSEEAKALSEILRLMPFGDPTELLYAINQIENRIGTPKIGTSRLQHVYNYVALNSQIKNLERERDLYANTEQ